MHSGRRKPVAAMLSAGVVAIGLFAGLWPAADPLQAIAAARSDGPAVAPAPATRTDHFGDPLPPDAVVRFGTSRFRHDGRVDSVAYSPDGGMIASGGAGRVVLWEAGTGRRIATLLTSGGDNPLEPRVPLPDVRCLRFTPGARSVVAIAGSPASHVPTYLLRWDLTGRKLVSATECRTTTTAIISPDGTTVVTFADPDHVILTDTTTGKPVATATVDNTYNMLFSPDGKTLAFVSGGQVVLLDPVTGKERRRLATGKVTGTLAFAADGESVWVGQNGNAWSQQPEPGALSRLSLATGAVVQKFATVPGGVSALVPSPDGTTLASGGEAAGPVLWDPSTGRGTDLAPEPLGVRPSVRDLAYAPDGKTLAAVDDHGRVRVWDVATRRELHRHDSHTREVVRVAVSPDQTAAATAGRDGTVRTWDLATGRPVRVWMADEKRTVLSLQYAPDGRCLVTSGDGGVRLWDAATGKEARRLVTLTGQGRAALSPDGKTVAVNERGDGTANVYDTATGRQVGAVRGRANALLDFVFSPDGQSLVSTHDEARSGRCGDRFGTPEGGGVHVWEVGTGTLLRRLACRVRGGLAVSPDGRVIAAAGYSDDGAVECLRFWDAASGAELVDRRLPGGDTIAFTADGRYLAVADREIRLIEAASGRVVRTFRSGSESRSLTFTRDGRRLVSAHDDGTAVVWDTVPERAAGDRGRLWDELAAADAGVAWRAGWALAADRSAVPLVGGKLRPAARPPGKSTAELIADLGADRFTVREEASRELVARVEVDGRELEAARVRSPSAEVRARLDVVLRAGRPRPWPRLEGQLLQAVRAVEVLERVGSPEAVAVLRELARGVPGARLTREAEDALKRLNKDP